MTGDDDRRTISVLTEVGAVSRPLDYHLPETFTGPNTVGSRVRVPLNGRSVRGWIVPSEGTTSLSSVKDVTASLGFGPPETVVALCRWAAWRWAGTAARFLGTASPSTLVPRLPVAPRLRTDIEVRGHLGKLGSELAGSTVATVVRVGPANDPFDLILGVLSLGAKAQECGSVVVLVPGLAYARRLTARLARRGIAAVDLAEGWDAARAGWPVVVGTRTAAFAPVPKVEAMIVLDADDARFASEAAPTWRAVDVVVERSRREGAPALLVTSCPTPELSVIEEQRAEPEAEGRAGWPRIIVVDRRDEDPRNGLLSSTLVDRSREALEAMPEGIAVACILNRTGRATLLACKRCQALARCDSCDAAVALDEVLRCPRCNEVRPILCTACGSTTLKRLRPGTAQLASELSSLLGLDVVEVTAKTDPEKLRGARAVMGTEAVLHRVRRAHLVAFLDLDHHLLAPRAGAELGTLAMIGRAGRLVGGRSEVDGGSVLLQTLLPDHSVITAALSGDPTEVIAGDLELRSTLGLPPFRAVALLKGKGAPEFARSMAEQGLDVRELDGDRSVVVALDHTSLAEGLVRAARPKDPVRISVDTVEL
ncbi:MAG: hypothetical protein WCI12_06335 [Actinomycetes bacterium]